MEFTDLIKTAKVDNVVLWKPHGNVKFTGTLCLTSHHILFSDRTSHKDELMLLYMAVEYLHRKLSGTSGVLTLICKDFTTFKLKIPGQEDAFNVAASIEALSTFETASMYYPFFFNRLSIKDNENGWLAFKMQEEYQKIISASSLWKVTSINENYEACSTYPKHLVVSSMVSDEILKKSAKFRQGGRLPVLCYLHTNKVPLLRSSQPLSGQGSKRCKEDEKLLSIILSGHSTKGQIIDTRSQQLASSQRAKGGGYESNQNYPQWIRSFQALERPSYLGESMNSLYQACSDYKSPTWYSKLDGSGWMTYVQDVLTVALKVAGYIHLSCAPVLVHGEKGTDITLLVTALSQILLDHNCRTIVGFQSLIVREWIWAGHPFTERHLKLGISPARRKEHAPVFLMFLDCVQQVIKQYPASFEFTEDFLLMIAQHSYSSKYGTFLFNNEWQREQSKLAEQTVSFWSHINTEEVSKNIRNPIYEENLNVLWPSVSPQGLSVWSSLYLKSPSSSVTETKREIMEMVVDVKNENIALKEKAKHLQREYLKLREAYVNTAGQ